VTVTIWKWEGGTRPARKCVFVPLHFLALPIQVQLVVLVSAYIVFQKILPYEYLFDDWLASSEKKFMQSLTAVADHSERVTVNSRQRLSRTSIGQASTPYNNTGRHLFRMRARSLGRLAILAIQWSKEHLKARPLTKYTPRSQQNFRKIQLHIKKYSVINKMVRKLSFSVCDTFKINDQCTLMQALAARCTNHPSQRHWDAHCNEPPWACPNTLWLTWISGPYVHLKLYLLFFCRTVL